MQPSLPRRLKFNRQHSDLTPKEKCETVVKSLFKDHGKKDKDALEAANIELQSKTKTLHEYEQRMEDLRKKSYQLSCLHRHKDEIIDEMEIRINELTKELGESDRANDLLKSISEKSIEKIEVLEAEIRLILKNHENEIDFLIEINAEEEKRSESYRIKNGKLKEDIATVNKELIDATDEVDVLRENVKQNVEKLQAMEARCQRTMDENVMLLTEIEEISHQAEKDMLRFVDENEKMLSDLDNLRAEKANLQNELSSKEGIITALNDEIIANDVDLDSKRDDIKLAFNADLKSISTKYEQQIATLKEVNDMKIKEIESIFVLERAKMIVDHTALLKNLQLTNQSEIERINELAEEKIRISEIQFEQKLNAMESTIEQSIRQEKYMWQTELDKCQKIAEAEIVQCEFEKQDLKTLLQSANELMRDKDETISGLHAKLNKENANFFKLREEYENEIKETRKECSRIMTEKYNYQLTLNNTRSTVNILMERLKKSDTDVEILKNDLELLTEEKLKEETRNIKLAEELVQLRAEADEYRSALAALRQSSLALEREVKEKESVFEKLMTSEEETLETVNKIGKLFNDKLEENISKYIDMYNEIKLKYDSRETYIKDMKALLDEFATGIELARIELDTKDKLLYDLQQENKLFKMENMTYKFKCEQLENEQNDDDKAPDDAMISKSVIAKIITQLESDGLETNEFTNTSLFCDEDKLVAENGSLKEKLVEKSKQIEFLKEMLEMENIHANENMELKKKVHVCLFFYYFFIIYTNSKNIGNFNNIR